MSKNKIVLVSFIAICLFLAYSPVKDRFYNALHYEPMVRITQADLEAITFLNSKVPAPILINGWSQFIEKHMPSWQITHTDFSSVELRNAAKNPSNSTSDELLPFKYFYIIDSQLGWAPGTEFGYAKNYLGNSNFLLLGEFTGASNHIYLFENLNY